MPALVCGTFHYGACRLFVALIHNVIQIPTPLTTDQIALYDKPDESRVGAQGRIFEYVRVRASPKKNKKNAACISGIDTPTQLGNRAQKGDSPHWPRHSFIMSLLTGVSLPMPFRKSFSFAS